MNKDKVSNPLLDAIETVQVQQGMTKTVSGDIVDIMTFCNHPDYLNLPKHNFNLFLSQRTILKTFYIGTVGNEDLKLTEEEWQWLKDNAEDEERDGVVYKKNCDQVIKKIRKKERNLGGKVPDFKKLHLVLGRRGSKCREKNELIATTEGSISFGELCDSINKGKKIGICTYDPNTLKRTVTYDLKAEDNGVVRCFEVETKRGIREISSHNHPYLVWRDGWEKPRFVKMSELLPKDRIATAKCTELFGRGGISVNKAALLGYFQGDGGTTHAIRFTTINKKILSDFTGLILKEFDSKYIVKPVTEDSIDYTVVKKTKRFKQNGSQKNEVKEWLKSVKCYGKKAIVKEIPECILKGSKEEVSVFLSRLFACDGWAHTAKKVQKNHGGVPKSSIGYGSSSRKLIDGVRHLLLKFGIHAVVSYCEVKLGDKKFDSWTLSIARKECIEKFKNEIGIFAKEEALNLTCNTANQRSEAKSKFDGIPIGIWEYIKAYKTKLSLRNRDFTGGQTYSDNRLRTLYSPSSKKILQYGNNTDNKFLKNMGTTDVKWDEVKTIINVGNKQTISLEVTGTNIIGGDIISHNTILASVITAYEVYKLFTINNGDPHEYYGLPHGAEIVIINVALSQKQAGLLFGAISDRIEGSDIFNGRVAYGNTQEIGIYTDRELEKIAADDSILSVKPSIKIMCGHSNPKTLRGNNAILLLFDELAFYDDTGKVTGSQFYNDLEPSVSHFVPYGHDRIVCISSPNASSGIFYDIFKSAEESDEVLAYQLPTWDVNPNVTYDSLTVKRKRNPDAFAIEYGAQWARSGLFGYYFPEELILRCVEHGVLNGIGPMLKPDPSFHYYLHVDPAKNGDRYVAVMVARENYRNTNMERRIRVRLAHVWVWEPTPGTGLLFNEIDKDVLRICQQFRPRLVTYDQYNSVHSLEFLKRCGIPIRETSYNRSYKMKIYQNLREMMSYHPNPELWLYDDHRLVLEMKCLRYRPTKRGYTLVKDKGGEVETDDIIDCLAGAASSATNVATMPLPRPVTVNMGFR